MKAIVYEEYGAPEDVLELRDIDNPEVADDEVMIRIRAASLNPYDWHFLRGLPYVMRLMIGLRKPRRAPVVLGSDMAGQVEAVGRSVTRFRPGDEVYAEVGIGSCAEYITVPEAKPALKPANLTFEQAAAVPMAAQTALVGVRDQANVQPGQKVLVNGASGGVGSFAVQLAKTLGAEVTGVCNTRNIEMVRSLGADHIIDYTHENFTEGNERYDFILDTVGNHPMSHNRRVLTSKGTYGAPGAGGGRWLGAATQQLKAAALSPFVSQKMVPVNDKPNKDLHYMKELIEAGEVTPVIDTTYPLSKAADAMRHVEEGHTRGKVVITVAEAD